MSHNVVIEDLKIGSLDALRMAVANLAKKGVAINLEVGKAKGDMRFRTYRGQDDRADAVIRLPNERYDVGLVQHKDGHYAAVFDASEMRRNGSISCDYRPGDNQYNDKNGIGKLMQEYGCVVAEIEAARGGHMSSRKELADGSIAVEIEMN